MVNRADGKHCGHIHIGQWCRGKVQLTHFIIWSLFTSFICTLTNIFIWSFLVHFFCISVKQTYPSKACVDPSMKWAYENNNLNLIFFYIQCIGKICGSREPWEFLRLSTVLLCRPVRGVWGGRQSARESEGKTSLRLKQQQYSFHPIILFSWSQDLLSNPCHWLGPNILGIGRGWPGRRTWWGIDWLIFLAKININILSFLHFQIGIDTR